GVDVGAAGMMALDLDPGHNINTVIERFNGLPETALRSSTPRGGTHLFYRLKPGETVAPSASKVAPHIDVRSLNSYVLLPPSRTDAGSYEWVLTGEPALRTDRMVEVCNTARIKTTDRDEWKIAPDLPENVEAAIRWLTSEARVAVEGQGGDAVAYATAAMLKSFGISEIKASELMWEHWNPRCLPPWDGGEWDHFATKVRNGYSYNTSPPGNITAAYRA
ncbi:MAG: bifunctional DNA primase/polymerase, partial [Rhodospirillaceae bacterium]